MKQILIALGLISFAYGQSSPLIQPTNRAMPAFAKNGMVVSQETLATQIGVEILEKGGNAIDAAVAVGFAKAVTLPRAGNLGGGGFMLIHLAAQNKSIALDYRETAPKAATPTMFLNEQGEPDIKKSRDSGLSVGVPGTVAGLIHAHTYYGSGKFTLAELVSPAIRLAKQGLSVIHDLADSLPQAERRLGQYPSSARIFLTPQGKAPELGTWLVQSDLGATLEKIARFGAKGFYEGDVAQKLVASIKAAGGIMTLEDLQNYKPIEREVVRGSYKGLEILSMPPPSSGGVHLIQMLNMLEKDALKANEAASIHLIVEAMKRAYADRAAWLGDPESVKVPLKGLISKNYAKTQRESFNLEATTPSSEIKAGNPLPFENEQTTHYSIIDKQGNAVSNTYTLNFSYGLGLVAEGTGVLLNNELDDFAAKAGASNGFGLVQGESNLPAPNKRPLSSMTPTIILKEGKVLMVTGTPGGSRIITMVLQNILNVTDFNMNIAESVAAPRFHHQWMPDMLEVEGGFSPDSLELLAKRGHKLQTRSGFGSISAILVTPQGITGAADPRQRGTLALGY